MPRDRISWIDVCRGIGIILVIYGHGLSAHAFRYVMYAFHMPLFFFLSGIVFHHRQHQAFWPYVKKSFRGILIPYLGFAILSFLLWLPDALPHLPLHTIVIQFLSTFYGNSNNGYLAFNNILWFLPCLFVVRIAFMLITQRTTTTQSLAFILAITSLLGYAFSLALPTLKLPFGTETAITGLVFYGMGYLWSTHATQLQTLMQTRVRLLTISIISLGLMYAFASFNFSLYGQQIDMRLNHLNNYALFYLGALCGILGCISVSMLIRKNTLLEYIGQHSLPLFAFHLLVFSYISRALVLFIPWDIINKGRDTYTTPIYTILAIGIILVIHMGYTKARILLTTK